LTVLACDLVSSTAQRTILGDDAADRLAVTLDHLLRHCVARYRGSVVKPTGDGLMAAFDAASDGVAAAIAMQQALHRHNETAPPAEHLVLRIGLSAGDVQYAGHDCHGTPVVEAARLEAAADPGSILVSGLVRSLSGSRNHHSFEPAGSFTLKGLGEPLAAFRVRWSPAPDADHGPEPVEGAATPRMPLPSALAHRPAVGVIGYARELETVAAATARVAAGEGQEVMLLVGEAGQGKTTLAAEAARAAYDDGACVLYGHCEEELARPYQLFSEALDTYVAHAPVDRLIAHVEAHGYELTRLVPGLARRIELAPDPRASDPETERFLLFAAATGLLAAAAERDPVVLVFDDLQWADKASLQLLTHLSASRRGARILVIGTIRDSEVARAQALREALGTLERHREVGRVELRGLAAAEVTEYMSALAGYRLTDPDEVALANTVHRETDGNPFYVSQVVRHLVETGALYKDRTGRWTGRGMSDGVTLPESVRAVIGGRVARLGEPAERVLALASVIGRDFDVDLLAGASATPVDELIDMLAAAAAAALAREIPGEPGHFQFSHALIQHTLYENLGPTRQAQAHRRVAVALDAICAGRPGARVGELARHWSSTTRPADRPKAIECSRQAGDAALAALAPSDALNHYTRALRLLADTPWPDRTLAIDLAIGLGTAQRQTGKPAFRDTLFDAARRAIELGDTPRLVAAALATHRGLFSNFGAIDAERVAIFEEALARMDERDPSRALILATYCLEVVVGSPLERRQALADEALDLAEASGDEMIMVRVLNNIAYALMSPPMLEQSLLRTAKGLERAARVGDPVLEFFAANWHRQACAQAGRIGEMHRCTELMAGLAERLNQPMLTWVHTFGLAWLAIIRGDTDEAERLAAEALETGTESGQPDAAFIYGGQIVVVYHQRGRLDELSPLIEEMASSNPNLGGVLRGALTAADLEAGRVEAARRRMEQLAANGYELEMNPVWVSGMAFYAEAAVELDDPDLAAPLVERLEPWATQWTDNGATGANPISHYLGGLWMVLGEHERAGRYLAQAASMSRTAGARFCLAQTELLWGRLLLRQGKGHERRASQLLESAATVAANAGYAGVLRRASTALDGLVEASHAS
jgi:class 3 adenylate cyclase/tetratricopeptide (TPR) repeat protein